MTSGGNRRLIICLGLADLGLPAFLKTARANISSVISTRGSDGASDATAQRLNDAVRHGECADCLAAAGWTQCGVKACTSSSNAARWKPR